MRLIDADLLEFDTEWSEYMDGYTSYSQFQIDNAPTVDAVVIKSDAIRNLTDEEAEILDRMMYSGAISTGVSLFEEIGERPKTNADRIRQMSDEELANILELRDCFGNGYRCPEWDSSCEECTCQEGFLKWLKQEASEDDKR